MAKLSPFLGVALVWLSGAAAAATPSSLDAAFSGKVISIYPDGRQAELWLSPDGSYTAEGRRHDRSSGHWKLQGARICLRQSKPPTLPFAYCTAVPSGTEATAKSVTGETIHVKVVPGRRSS